MTGVLENVLKIYSIIETIAESERLILKKGEAEGVFHS